MNLGIEILNQLGNSWAGLAWSGFWQSSILIGALWILDPLLKRRVRPVVRHAVWLLVPIKLLLPPSIGLPLSIGYWMPRPTAQVGSPGSGEWVIHLDRTASRTPSADPQLVQPSTRPPESLHPAAIGLLAWAAGAAMLLGAMARGSRRVQRIADVPAQPAGTVAQHLEELQRHLGLRQALRLHWISPGQSPALYGLWRPRLLMPTALDDMLSPTQLRSVLLHELVHARRGDAWVNALQTLVQVLWWWHPLVWFANARLRAVREEAVDEEVAFHLGPEAHAYPEALLAVARTVVRQPRMGLATAAIIESRSLLRTRIERLSSGAPPRPPRLGFPSLVGVALTALLALPMAGANRHDESSPDPLPASTGQVTAVETTWKDDSAAAHAAEAPPDLPLSDRANTHLQLKTVTWKVDYAVLIPALEERIHRPLGEDHSAWTLALKEVLESSGVSLEPPAALYLSLRNARLMFRGPEHQLNKARAVVDELLSRTPPYIQIEAAFLELEDQAFLDLISTVGRDKWEAMGPRRFAMGLNPDQQRAFLRAVRNHPGVTRLGAPRMTTLDGRAAGITQKDAATNSVMELSAHVLPRVVAEGRGILLETTATWTMPYKLQSMTPVVGVRAPTDEAQQSPGVYSINATGYITRSITNAMVIIDGGCQVLGDSEPGPVGSPGKQVLVILSAFQIDPAGNPIHPPSGSSAK